MNLLTQNSPYYHLLKYLLFLLKHPVCVLKIFWWWGSIKSSLALSLFKWFKCTDVAETSCISVMIETVFISETLVYLNHLLQLSNRDFIEIDIVCHFWNQYFLSRLSLLKSIFSITSEIDIVCHFWNRYCLSLLKSILFVTSEINIFYHFWNQYCLSLLKSILSITSEIIIFCHFWNWYCLSLLKSVLSVTSEINIFYHFWNWYCVSLLKSILSVTFAGSTVWCSGKQMNMTGSQAHNGLEPRVYWVRLVQG